jgi:hypothetical protein
MLNLNFVVMKQIKKIKLNRLVNSKLSKNWSKGIVGGTACTDYSCQCSANQDASYVDGLLDGRAECGYLP